MTRQIYIITKEGRGYSTDGLNYIREILQEIHIDPSNPEFNMGAAYNDPKTLCRALTKHPDAVIVLSAKNAVICFPPDVNRKIMQNLNTDSGKSSWEHLMQSAGQTIY